MKFSESWLREWVDPPISTQELATQLTMAGNEVDSVEPVASDFTEVVVGEITSAVQHPDADRLRVCQVNVGDSTPLNIVCGAANARAGIKVAVALVGARLNENFTIKKAKLRGVESHGMLCSLSELGLAQASQGIIELPIDAPLGKDIRDYLQLNDHMIELDLTPNRGDLLSIAGIAREIGVLNNCDVRTLQINSVAPMVDDVIDVSISAKKDCPRYVGRVIQGVDPSATTPLWMQEKLRRSNLRSINPIVDVTNYVLLELGQPLHAFDLATLKGGITVRKAKLSEKLTLLDGQTIEMDSDTLVIADQEKPLALAGIMGGIESSVGDQTQDVFLESAFFTPTEIAGRARRYGLHTDSSHRFERGVAPSLAGLAIERATQLLLEIVGGKPGPVIDVKDDHALAALPAITLRRERIARVLGITLEEQEIENILRRLGNVLTKQQEGWLVNVPDYRFDIRIEEDLIEEIARIYGYDKIKAQIPEGQLRILPGTEKKETYNQLRYALVARGYREAITYSFVSGEIESLLNEQAKPLKLRNPISPELSVMRTSLWSSLLTAIQYNQHRQQARLRFFETGLRFIPSEKALLQEAMIAGVVCGTPDPEQWGSKQVALDFFDIKNDVEAMLATTKDSDSFTFINAAHPALHPGQSCKIRRKQRDIGFMGALHPRILQALDLVGPVFLFELNLAEIEMAKVTEFKILSKFPMLRRDLSFIVDSTITAEAICNAVFDHAGELLVDAAIFDVYQGPGIPDNKKSIALGLTLQHPARTLVDEEVSEIVQRIVEGLKKAYSVTIR